MRTSIASAVAMVIGMSLAQGALAEAQVAAESRAEEGVRSLSIPAGDLTEALRVLAKQTGSDLVFRPEQVQGVKTEGVEGNLTTQEALERILKGTNLRANTDKSTGAVLIAVPMAQAADAKPIRLAQAESAGMTSTEKVSEFHPDLAEIVVTANRRKQRAQDVPLTLQVFSGADLEKQGAKGFSDYLNTVPGLGLRQQGNGTAKITIRGISNVGGDDSGWGTTTTTGVYLNDVAIQGTDVPPDLGLYDLDRIEVLKGPQGTLYGEGAMGGAIKMTLKAPNLREIEGKTDVSTSWTKDGGVNYGVRGVANLPLVEDRVALRISGTYRDDEGFVENVLRGEKNQDDSRAYSVRGILAAEITSALSAELLALHNRLKMDDFPQVDNFDGYQISSAEDRYNDVKSTLVALSLKSDFEFAELTSVTANLSLDRDLLEITPFGRYFFGQESGNPIFSNVVITQDPYRMVTGLKSFSQELRLVSKGDHRVNWIVGAFYRDKKQNAPNIGYIAAEDLPAVNAALAGASLPQLPADGRYIDGLVEQDYEQYALYGEGSLHLGHGFEFTAGLRWYNEEVNTAVKAVGYSLMDVYTTQSVMPTIEEDGVIPKFALSYKASADHMLYAQAAKGFRAGAGNANFSLAGDEGAKSDRLWSYEIGSKNSFASGSVIFNAAAFYLDWQGIQAIAILPAKIPPHLDTPVTDNAGDAEIYGFEAELGATAMDAITFGAALGYTHSELTKSLGAALVGAPIPGTPKWTASGYAEYHVPVSLGEAFLRFDVRHNGKQLAKLAQVDALGNVTYDGTPLDAYTVGNLRVGLSSTRGWGAAFFVNNLWNERVVLGAGADLGSGIFGPTRYSIDRPRTFGLTVSLDF